MKSSIFSPSQSRTLALVALFLLCWYGWRHFSHQSVGFPQPVSSYVFFQLTGKVEKPGIYCFNKSVTVSEAVARGGGLLPPLKLGTRADWDGVEVENAGRVHVEAGPDGYAALRIGWMDVPSRLAIGVPLNINRASTTDLSSVPGVSEKLVERIVMTRKHTGGFSEMNDLLAVKGIGPATVRKLEPYLTLGTGN